MGDTTKEFAQLSALTALLLTNNRFGKFACLNAHHVHHRSGSKAKVPSASLILVHTKAISKSNKMVRMVANVGSALWRATIDKIKNRTTKDVM